MHPQSVHPVRASGQARRWGAGRCSTDAHSPNLRQAFRAAGLRGFFPPKQNPRPPTRRSPAESMRGERKSLGGAGITQNECIMKLHREITDEIKTT
jgi:hypothetical protein